MRGMGTCVGETSFCIGPNGAIGIGEESFRFVEEFILPSVPSTPWGVIESESLIRCRNQRERFGIEERYFTGVGRVEESEAL